jgi:NitT/TauT family transport system substrate-binding protein
MHWINTHTAAQIAAKMPAEFVSNNLTSRADYISALAKDRGQFLADGIMPKSGPATVLNVDKLAGKVTGTVNLATTYTNAFAIKANKLEHFKITTK